MILIKNIKRICGLIPKSKTVLKGKEMAEAFSRDNAYLLIRNGMIAEIGSMDTLPVLSENTRIIDATGCFILPGFVDSHTHIVFAETREMEYVDRLKGMTYEQIAANGGGILNSAKKLNETSEDELFETAWGRLRQMIAWGTLGVEIKSGYGLTIEGELKMLRVIQRLKNKSPIPVKSTFLGAHAIPLQYKEKRSEYINILIQDLLPKIAEENLADYCDVFCDKGFYTTYETDTILKAAASFGLKAKIHANELGISGGVQVGVANNAISVDHLENIGPEEILCLRQSNTIATVLPGTSFFLGIPYAPARLMIDEGLAVCIASDFNPGSSPCGRMSMMLSLACTQMKLLPEEALNATTINGAAALEMSDVAGSIAEGKKANLIITKPIQSLAALPYHFGNDMIEKVLIYGQEWIP